MDKARKRTSPKIKFTNLTRLPPESNTFVAVATRREVVIMVGPQKQLNEKLGCRTASGVANVQLDQPSRVLVANFNLHPVDLKHHQVVAMASAHPEKIVESDITHAELLGLIPDDDDTKYQKGLVMFGTSARSTNNSLTKENVTWATIRSP